LRREGTAKVPHGHWRTTTFLAACPGSTRCLFQGPINGERFLAYGEQELYPQEGRNRHCQKLGSHKSKAVRRTIRKVGARLFFLPKIFS